MRDIDSITHKTRQYTTMQHNLEHCNTMKEKYNTKQHNEAYLKTIQHTKIQWTKRPWNSDIPKRYRDVWVWILFNNQPVMKSTFTHEDHRPRGLSLLMDGLFILLCKYILYFSQTIKNLYSCNEIHHAMLQVARVDQVYAWIHA